MAEVAEIKPPPASEKRGAKNGLEQKDPLRVLPVSEGIEDEAGADKAEDKAPDDTEEAFSPPGDDGRGIQLEYIEEKEIGSYREDSRPCKMLNRIDCRCQNNAGGGLSRQEKKKKINDSDAGFAKSVAFTHC
jgi:hypothetical protein